MEQNILHTICIIIFGIILTFFGQINKYAHIYNLDNYGIEINYVSLNSRFLSIIDEIKKPKIIQFNSWFVDKSQLIVDKVNYVREDINENRGDSDIQKNTRKNLNQLQINQNHLDSIHKKPRFLIIGDSMISEGFGIALEKHLIGQNGVEVKRWGKPSTGLSRPDYFNWEDKFIELYDDYEPNRVIVMFGANDGQSIRGLDSGTIRESDPRWDIEYAKRVESLINLFEERELIVYWIGNPVASSEKYSNKMQRINTIVQSGIVDYNSVTFISTWELLRDSSGNYSDYIVDDSGISRLARSHDGIHVTSFGAQLLVEGIKDQIVINQEKL